VVFRPTNAGGAGRRALMAQTTLLQQLPRRTFIAKPSHEVP
jgi:hypothetical protein